MAREQYEVFPLDSNRTTNQEEFRKKSNIIQLTIINLIGCLYNKATC